MPSRSPQTNEALSALHVSCLPQQVQCTLAKCSNHVRINHREPYSHPSLPGSGLFHARTLVHPRYVCLCSASVRRKRLSHGSISDSKQPSYRLFPGARCFFHVRESLTRNLALGPFLHLHHKLSSGEMKVWFIYLFYFFVWGKRIVNHLERLDYLYVMNWIVLWCKKISF